MDKFEKRWFRFYIVKHDPIYTWNFEKDYFELGWSETSRIAQYAEIFGIKPDSQGRSTSRVLWYQLQRCAEYLKKEGHPF